MGVMQLIEKQSRFARLESLETVVKCIGILSGLLPDEQSAGNELATFFMYSLKDELQWIPLFLRNNSNIVLAEYYLVKWNNLLEGKSHKTTVWDPSLDKISGLVRDIFSS